MNAGGELQTIYGVANGVTTPDSLLYTLYLQQMYSRHTYAGAIEDEYANATFHPKFFEFKFVHKTIAIVGSANLTGAGMSRNTEIGIEVDIPDGHPLATRMDAVWSSMRAASEVVTLPLIRASKHEGELGSENQKSETRSDKANKPWMTTPVAAINGPRFEEAVRQAFREQGYEVKDHRHYDGRGGDVDILVSPPARHGLFQPDEIAVQVKWKQGVDAHDEGAVGQIGDVPEL